MNLRDLRSRVRDLIGDPQDEQHLLPTYSDETILAAINWAIGMLCDRSGCTFTLLQPLPMLSGSVASLPDDLVKVKEVSNAGAVLDESDPHLESIMDPSWRAMVGAPLRWIRESGSTIRIVPGGQAKGLALGYIAKPDDLLGDADEVDSRIPLFFQTAIPYGASAFLYQQDADEQDLQKAESLMSQFGQMIKGAAIR